MSEKNPNEKLADIFSKNLDAIYKHLENQAAEFNSTSVPLKLVKQAYDIFKKNYRKGIRGNAKGKR